MSAVPVCIGRKHTVVITGTHGFNRPSLRDDFNGFLRILSGDEFVLSPSSAELIANGIVVAYKQQMSVIRQTETFAAWLHHLRDAKARAKVLVRIQHLEDGNPGDVAPVGDGVSELRIHYGPGYRVYYVNRGGEIVLLLCGGDKASQSRDIEAAKRLAQTEQ